MNQVKKCIDLEKLSFWIQRLEEIIEIKVIYQEIQLDMANIVIKEMQGKARAIVEDIKYELNGGRK